MGGHPTVCLFVRVFCFFLWFFFGGGGGGAGSSNLCAGWESCLIVWGPGHELWVFVCHKRFIPETHLGS